MSFGSDDDTDITGGTIERTGRVTFDHNSSQVIGWDSIWAIIEGEEKDKDLLRDRLQNGVTDYVRERDSKPLAKGPIFA